MSVRSFAGGAVLLSMVGGFVSVLAGPLFAAQPIATVRVATGLSQPVDAQAPAGDATRLWIVEKGAGGTAAIKTINLNNPAAAPVNYLTVTGLAHNGNEQGLLGLAFHPDFAANGKFYVNQTVPGGSFGNGITQVREYTVPGGNPLAATTAGSVVRTVMQFDQPQDNHNGGWIGFNPKITPTTPQYLYVATGDGGSGNDSGTGHVSGGNAQSKATLLGKMLRIDPLGGDALPADLNNNYAIPAANFFQADNDGATRGEIVAYGLRNPWRSSFDRTTGDLYIGDVGQDSREEISFIPGGSNGGQNFGWRLREGTQQTPAGGIGGPAPGDHVGPIHDYDSTGFAAVAGGYVYRGSNPALSEYLGTYFFADTFQTNIWSLKYTGAFIPTAANLDAQLEPAGAPTITNVTAFGEDALGELYIVDYADGEVYKIVPEPAGLALVLIGLLPLRRARRR